MQIGSASKFGVRAEVIEGDAKSQAQLTPADYKARVERVIRLKMIAWDANCPQHIPKKIDAADIEQALAMRDQRIADLELKLKRYTNID